MASGLRPATLSPSSGSLSLRLRDSHPLASPRNATRRFILQKTRRKRYTPATSCRSTVSGSVSLPSPGFFSPFPHGTPALSVAVLYSALDRGRPGFGQGSSCPALLRYRIMEGIGLTYGAVTLFGGAVRRLPLPPPLFTPRDIPMRPYNPGLLRFGLLRVRSPLLAESRLISSPGLLRWFTSPGLAPPRYLLRARGARLAARGLPHSAVRGSRDMCSSPRLFAAYRGLHRHAAPQASAMDLPLA